MSFTVTHRYRVSQKFCNITFSRFPSSLVMQRFYWRSCTSSGENRPITLWYTSIRSRRAFVILPGATDNEHQASRRYGIRRPVGWTKHSHVSFHATGFVLWNAVLWAVSVKPDVTQVIVFRWRKWFYQRETLGKEWFDRQHVAPQVAKMVLYKFIRVEGTPKGFCCWRINSSWVKVSNLRNCDTTETLLVV